MTPYNLHFLRILVFQKTHSLLRLIFRATGLRQKFKFDTFQKGLYNTLASSTNLVLKVVPIVTGVYLWRYFTCSYKKQIIFGLFHVLAQFTFSASKTGPVYYQKKVKARVASRVSLWLTAKGSFKKILEMPSWPRKRSLLTHVLENCIKPAVKHSREKPILLHFVSLFTMLCSSLWLTLSFYSNSSCSIFFIKKLWTTEARPLL